VDLYHAREHLWNLAPKLYPDNAARQKRWIMAAQDKLDNGRIESLLTSLRALRPAATEAIDMVRTEAGYFEANAARMRYPEFRRQGLFVGTGVMEAGCRTVIGTRLKQSGMFWTVRGANAIIALRCCQLSGTILKTIGRHVVPDPHFWVVGQFGYVAQIILPAAGFQPALAA